MNIFQIIVVLSSTMLLCGCFTVKEDISKTHVYHTDYVVGKIYKTKRALFMQRLGNVEMLVAPGDANARIPRSIESYLAQRDRWPEIVGVLEKGTSVRVTRLVREYNQETGSVFFVFATILDGVHCGRAVDLRAISLDYQQTNPVVSVPFCNRNLLEEIE